MMSFFILPEKGQYEAITNNQDAITKNKLLCWILNNFFGQFGACFLVIDYLELKFNRTECYKLSVQVA